jgi:hypothetical protein
VIDACVVKEVELNLRKAELSCRRLSEKEGWVVAELFPRDISKTAPILYARNFSLQKHRFNNYIIYIKSL